MSEATAINSADSDDVTANRQKQGQRQRGGWHKWNSNSIGGSRMYERVVGHLNECDRVLICEGSWKYLKRRERGWRKRRRDP